MTQAPQTADPILTVKDAHCVFNTSQRETLFGPPKKLKAVSGVSFDILRGELFGVVGESGCGKSTTAKLILNMARVSQGEITFDGQSLLGLSDTEWKPLRRRVQYVFQDPLGALDPRMVVLDQVVEPLTIHAIDEANRAITEAADPDANVIIGLIEDPTMGDTVQVTVIATDFEHEDRAAQKDVEVRVVGESIPQSNLNTHTDTNQPTSPFPRKAPLVNNTSGGFSMDEFHLPSLRRRRR